MYVFVYSITQVIPFDLIYAPARLHPNGAHYVILVSDIQRRRHKSRHPASAAAAAL